MSWSWMICSAYCRYDNRNMQVLGIQGSTVNSCNLSVCGVNDNFLEIPLTRMPALVHHQGQQARGYCGSWWVNGDVPCVYGML